MDFGTLISNNVVISIFTIAVLGELSTDCVILRFIYFSFRLTKISFKFYLWQVIATQIISIVAYLVTKFRINKQLLIHLLLS